MADRQSRTAFLERTRSKSSRALSSLPTTSSVAEPVEPPDNPLPTADPAFAPTRRPCMERGCQYRSRVVVYGGWLLAVLALLANVAIGHDLVQVDRARAALTVERDTLRAQFLPVRQAPPPPEVVVP